MFLANFTSIFAANMAPLSNFRQGEAFQMKCTNIVVFVLTNM
jgi:hypothetical protein